MTNNVRFTFSVGDTIYTGGEHLVGVEQDNRIGDAKYTI